MTKDEIEARTLNKAAVYFGHLFREHIVAEAKLILQAVVTHERSMARACQEVADA